MAKRSLRCFHVGLRHRHHPRCQAAPERMQTEPLTIGYDHARFKRCGPKVIRDEDASRYWDSPVQFERRKNPIAVRCVRRNLAPLTQELEQRRMACNRGFGSFCFRLVQACSRPATEYMYQSVPYVSPSQTNCFGRTQAGAGDQQHQHLMQGIFQHVYDPHRFGRRHDDWLVVRLHPLETPSACGIGRHKLLEHSECENSTHRVLAFLHRLAL